MNVNDWIDLRPFQYPWIVDATLSCVRNDSVIYAVCEVSCEFVQIYYGDKMIKQSCQWDTREQISAKFEFKLNYI